VDFNSSGFILRVRLLVFVVEPHDQSRCGGEVENPNVLRGTLPYQSNPLFIILITDSFTVLN
jgi:hypothetical protein